MSQTSKMCSEEEIHANSTYHVADRCQQHFYKMDHSSRGLAIIFAHHTFEIVDEDLRDRGCSEKDIELSTRCFEGLGFEVRINRDKKLWEIEQILNEVSREDHSNRSCLVIIISTHGKSDNFLYASDSPYHTYKLFRPFHAAKCQTLAGKPKLYFIQACRGGDAHIGIELQPYEASMSSTSAENSRRKVFLQATCSDDDDAVGKSEEYENGDYCLNEIEDDFLVSFSTIPGYISFQNSNGSWFIRILCEKLNEHSKSHILQILTYVNGDIAIHNESNNPKVPNYHKMKQMSSVTSRLKKFLVLAR